MRSLLDLQEEQFRLIELASINKVTLVLVSSCSKHWINKRWSSLEVIELSSINKVSLVIFNV